MIISENRKPLLEEFRVLMAKTDAMLNAEAKGRESYYKGRNGTQLEEDVCDALSRCAVINTNIRDQFSAGGRVDIVTVNGVYERMPAAFGRIQRYKDLIVETIISANPEVLKEHWKMIDLPENRLLYWCQQVAICAGATKDETHTYYGLLRSIFNI